MLIVSYVYINVNIDRIKKNEKNVEIHIQFILLVQVFYLDLFMNL